MRGSPVSKLLAVEYLEGIAEHGLAWEGFIGNQTNSLEGTGHPTMPTDAFLGHSLSLVAPTAADFAQCHPLSPSPHLLLSVWASHWGLGCPTVPAPHPRGAWV